MIVQRSFIIINQKITKELFKFQDLKYRDFQSKLIPNIDKEKIIGVRTAVLRDLAKQFVKNGLGCEFMSSLPHKFFEENQLHGFIISNIKDYDKCILELNKFLPYIDNWATCDQIRPIIFNKNKDRLLKEIKKWIKSSNTFTVRFGVGMLMKYFLDENFKKEYLNIVAKIKSDEYYINMMVAWFFATALAKQYDDAVSYLENKKLSEWVHNKTIQKAIESYRITKNQKEYLKTLRIK